MDFHLKQCRNQEESEPQQHSAKIPNLFFHHQPESSVSSVLPLFVPDFNSSKTSTILSAFPDSTSSSIPFPRMWGFFSVAQRQELELQAQIFRYMLAGAAVPPELLLPIKKSLLSSASPFFLQHFPQYPTSLLQAGYWGRAAVDPEPGRCRRTDGKKWRCSRDVVAGQKYCERHMHRGRNRSRKPVETATINPSNATGGGGGGGCSFSSNINRVIGGGGRPFLTGESGNRFGQTPSVDLLHPNERPYSNSLLENKNCYESNKEGSTTDNSKSDGHLLRHFFDDWPRSNNSEHDNNVTASTTSLSISIPENLPSSSDISLKLSTGGSFDQNDSHNIHQDVNGWAATQVTSMGGPLAEVLRSPTSVLHQLRKATTNSEASFIST